MPGMPRIGIGLPNFGPEAGPEAILRIASTVERLGFHGVSVCDRLLLPLGEEWENTYGLPDSYIFDPVETLTFVAARTGRIRLATTIVNSPFQSPIVLARRLATLDQLSGGRLDAGIGLGWMPEEYAASGVPYAERGARFEDHLAAMRACLGPDPVQHDGPFYQVPKAKIGPKPVNGRLCVLVGGVAKPAIERAARLGDGFIAAIREWETTLQEIAWYRAAGGTGMVMLRTASSWDAQAEDPIGMSVAAMMADLTTFAEAGVDEVHWDLTLAGIGIDRQIEVLEALAMHV
ncbi:MAG TPA: TIGR03619 family F420-dependent LLM class oxidoreductase [Thermomicrobiales bacterium]|nr:TIGR03619 family F420-dependent LLM class oxidoreductase [Thermomicrobiales bacterium]